ncbi:hypothetical protein EJ05DRAFT_474773 [Pseudovirgaria hyperparasitica]|uniref:DNA/RNA-binding protein Alba-like domain-containing protein n=1 Tax=Pseudovirgaria hyperparasitica TaxID=470096 RepID=A0A6A6WCM3_9PEZI|nr:uncharacterized protein EJ05DRAFT_474773 [Pseudovirgaria hyperparasitica]KAF2759710.1 hypothetical protein EJ05DRAFT_474773 [Pseudovirgaria hyperparasitica]
MARGNKFKKSKAPEDPTIDFPILKKLANPSILPVESTTSRTHPRDPSSSDDHARTRPRTAAKPWADGDEEPRFATPNQPIQFHSQQSKHPEAVQHSGPPSYSSLLPSHLATNLEKSFDVHALNISSGSKINAKVKSLLGLLENGFDFGKTDQKPGVVALTAKAGTANKMISVVEIAKRELEKEKLKWFQYSAVGSRIEELKEKLKKEEGKGQKGNGRAFGGDTADTEDVNMVEEIEEEAFETMVLPERKKVRAVPYLTVYMARVPVQLLKAEYGEQMYDPRKDQR